MSVSQAELNSFHEFATCRIDEGLAETLSDCVEQWEVEKSESITAIREALEDSAAGRSQSVDEAFAQIRRELGFPERRPVS